MLFKFASGLYGVSLICILAFDRRPKAALFFLVPALLVNAAVVAWRYWSAWPMLPMYMGPVVLPLLLGMIIVFSGHAHDGWVWPAILALIVIIAMAAVLFPKDYYIPFVRSQTVWAHLFFWLGVAGRACFLVAAVWAMADLKKRNGVPEMGGRRNREKRRIGELDLSPSTPRRVSPFPRSMQWIVWGFALWTLSMFTGELWSYLGWGTPVVWDDPAITTTMATWFFYICLLHLHLTGSWSARWRSAYAAAGGLVVLGVNCVPDLGPFRWPL